MKSETQTSKSEDETGINGDMKSATGSLRRRGTQLSLSRVKSQKNPVSQDKCVSLQGIQCRFPAV